MLAIRGRTSKAIHSAFIIAAVLAVAGCERGRRASGNSPLPPPGTATAPGLFRDVAAAAGIDFRHDPGLSGRFLFPETTPGGCALLDYDMDGRPDVFLVQSGPAPGMALTESRPPCRLYRNEGDHEHPRFRDVTAAAGLDRDFGCLQGVSVADYDNDGFPDLFLTGYGGCRLLHNNGKGRFADVTEAAGLTDREQGPRWATSSAWADYDGDGLLDLYVCHYCRWSPATEATCVNRLGQRSYCTPTQYEPETGRLYRNLGGGRFRDVTHEAGLDVKKGRGLGCVWLDYDGDGRPDLYVANDLNPNLLFHNLGRGKFQEVGLEAGVAYGADGRGLSGMGIAAGDYDGDGREDLYVTNFSGQTNSLFRSDGRAEFRHATQEAGLSAATYAMLGWGVAFLDFDRDGWPDLVVGNGHVNPDIEQTAIGVGYYEPKGLYRNRGDGAFEDFAAHRGDMAHPRGTRGLAVGDFDNDGRPDVLCNNLGGPAELFQNSGTDSNHFLSIRLAGTRSNREGIGARVAVAAGNRTRFAWCRRCSSYCSANDVRLLFGLGSAERVDKVEVRWPSGAVDSIKLLGGQPISADRFLLVTEGKGAMLDPLVKGAAR